MYYDLNVPWTDNLRELQRTVAFLDELGYDVIALTHTLSGKPPSDLTPPIPQTLPFPTPSRMRILRRCTLYLTDTSTNHLVPQLQQHYDIIAARPTSERTLQQACANLDVDLISLDLTQRPEKHFKFSMLGSAIARGVKIEICYSQALLSGDSAAKRTMISNIVQLIRVTRGGRGLVFSSEAKNALGIRAPADVINLASIWGLGHERGKDGLTREPRSVVEFARLKHTSYRGVVDIIHGGEKPAPEAKKEKGQKQQSQQKKRKSESTEGTPVGTPAGDEKGASKRQQKRSKKA